MNKRPKIIAVASGKGGVGKTSLTVNAGIALAQKGHQVCLFDADSNLANINIMLGLLPEYTLEQVIKGEKSIQDTLLEKNGMQLVPGATGITDFVNLQREQQQRLVQALSELEQTFDIMLVDTSAGIHENVLSFIEYAHQCLLVVTAEPTSLTDAFSLLRVLKKRGYSKDINVLVNSVESELSARKVFKRFSTAVVKYIGYQVKYLEYVAKDELLSSSICLQKPIIVHDPDALSSRCFSRLADQLVLLSEQDEQTENLSEIWGNQLGQDDTADSSHHAVEDLQQQYKSNTLRTKRQLLVDHKQAILEYIDDPDMSKQEVTATLQGFVEAYQKRFNDYPLDAVQMLNHALELNRISQSQVNEIVTTLQLFYEGKTHQDDKEASAQFMRQQINAYVEQYGEYPFDTVYALLQSLQMDHLSSHQLRELLITLNLVYQDKNLTAVDQQNDNEKPVYSVLHDQEEVLRLTASIRRKCLHMLEGNALVAADQLADEITDKPEADNHNNDLLDSIHFASLIE